MSFFHVVVTTKNSGKRRVIYQDLSKSELKKNFVKPYKKGNDLFIDGTILPVKELARVKIVSSPTDIETFLTEEQEKREKSLEEFNRNLYIHIYGSAWKYEDIEIKADDVTIIYLNEAPGMGTLESKLLNILNHPWTLRVGGGILLIIVGTLLVKN